MLDEEHTGLRSDGEFATLQDQTLCALLATAEERSESFDLADEHGLWVGLVIDDVACLAVERGEADAVVMDDAFLADGDFDGGHGYFQLSELVPVTYPAAMWRSMTLSRAEVTTLNTVSLRRHAAPSLWHRGIAAFIFSARYAGEL